MIPTAIPNVGDSERRNLNACIDTGMVSSVGQFVTEFEEKLCATSGATAAVATSSGTTALAIALLAAGIKADEYVFCPDFTFIATANAISHIGAHPILIDVKSDDWTLCPRTLSAFIDTRCAVVDGRLTLKQDGRAITGIVPVLTMGHPVDLASINRIAREHKLTIVLDAAAALGAASDGQRLGEMECAASTLSFNGNKTFTCGGGGAVLTSNEEVARLARHLSTTAKVGDKFDHDMVGYNFRMTNLQAAVGCGQIDRCDEFLSTKRRIYERYRDGLADIQNVTPFPVMPGAQSAHWLSGFFLSGDDVDAQSLFAEFSAKGIGVKEFWRPMHIQKPYRSSPQSAVTVSSSIYQRIIVLPCSTSITDSELDFVIETTRSLLQSA